MWDREHLNHVYESMVNQGIYADWNATPECSSIYKVKGWNQLKYAQKSKLMAVIQMVKDTPQYDLYSVHDEFFQHPNFCMTTKVMYQQVLAEIAESNLLDSIITDIMGEPSNVIPTGNRKECAAAIRKGMYGIA